MSIELKEAAQDAAEAIDWLLKNIRLDAPQLSGKAMGNAEKCASALRAALAQQPATGEQEADGLPPIVAGAVFDFAGFMTTRSEVIEVGSVAAAGPVAELVKEWAELRGLDLANAAVLSWQLHITRASLPATPEPVLFIHPDTFAMNNAHVGAWKPGHELTGYIPLYTHPAPSVPVVGPFVATYSSESIGGKQHDTGRVNKGPRGGFFASTASVEDASLIAGALNAYTRPAPSVPNLIEKAISSGCFNVLPVKATVPMCKAGWGASGGELTFQQIGHIYEEMYKARPLPDDAIYAAPSVPEGYALVPIEPTQAMMNVQTWDFSSFYSPREIWAAMLAAKDSK